MSKIDQQTTERERKLEQIIQDMHKHYNPDNGEFDIEAALKTIMTLRERKTQTTEQVQIIITYRDVENNETLSLTSSWDKVPDQANAGIKASELIDKLYKAVR